MGKQLEKLSQVAQHFAFALEDQQDGWKHFYVAVKLDVPKPWLSVKNSLQANYNIAVNFPESLVIHYSANRYGTTLDARCRTPRLNRHVSESLIKNNSKISHEFFGK